MASVEAGPSRVNPHPSTPPAKGRRRSWFSFATPASSTFSPTRYDKTSFAPDDAPGDEVELAAVGSTTPTSTPIAEDEREPEELLDIDGDPEKTVRKKKSRKLKKPTVGEALRMDDLAGKSSVRKTSRESAPKLEPDPGGRPSIPKHQSLAPHSSTPVSSDKEELSPFFVQKSSPNVHVDLVALSQAPLTSNPPRSSPTSPTVPVIFEEKSQPPIPLERPLPPLPPHNPAGTSLVVPRGIVVTPSSPRKSANEPRSSSSPPVQLFDTEGGRGRTGSRSKSSSRIPRKFNSANSSLIGLGLPGELPRTSSFDDDRPPPVPEKSQSVSSPLPSRTASPVPEIAFTEPERVREKADGSSIKQVEEGRRGRVKRSHSLSGIVSQPANVLNTDHSDAVASDAPEANGETPVDTSETGSTKAHGVLGWLGVRRTIKRRRSESRIKKDDGSEGDSKTSAKPDTKDISGNQEKVKSRESLGLDAELLQIEKNPRRPELRTESSGGTVMPQAAPGKLASLFTRRASSEATEFTEPIESTLQVTPVALPAEARAIHNAILRNSTAGSSQSSLTLPPSEPAFSPFMIPQSDTWITSPTTDAEEMLYSPSGSSRWGPGIRPWVDSAISGNGSNRSSMSSPLGSMPEQGILDLTSAPKLLTNVREGRVRSWSDASILQPNRPAQSSSSHLPINPDDPSISRSLQPSPLTPTRPKLDGRASSGNSAIMGRMRTVFSRSGSRSRANSLLRQRSSDTDEFGRLSADVWPRGIRMRPSFSSSSDVASSRLSVQDDLPYVSLLGLEGGSPNPSTETSRRSPTSSPGPSILPTVTASNRQPVEKDLRAHQRINRPRASTLSTGASITSFVGPPSPGLFPTAATPPRRRPSVIHRVSNGRFGSDPSSPKASASLFPLPPRFTGTPVIAGALTHGDAGMTSQVTSPRPSFGSIAAAMDSSVIKQVAKRQDEETPEMWSNRVAMKISRAEIAGVLTASADDFCAEALRIYMTRFDFKHNPLDVALRKLLMHMSLPRETQQIDRIIEAFAVRYEQCEPGLFVQTDNTYVLAFSMMMLHTDAFNKHNRYKMTKTDYVRNTRLDDVPHLVLEAFYDNITFTPFVFIEDDADLGQIFSSSSTLTASATSPVLSPPAAIVRSGKIDVYHMIAGDLLGSLHLSIEETIPAQSPFSAFGTRPLLDIQNLHRAFTLAHTLQITAPPLRKNSAAGLLSSTPAKPTTSEADLTLKVTKIGLLSRKDDASESGRKVSRKWKSWSVILTGSQLLFFKDPIWALTLLEQAQSLDVNEASGQLLLPRMTTFKPDEVFSVKDCGVIYDRCFVQSPNTFLFVMPHSRHYLLQASDEFEMNEWIALINYASAFKTADIRMRGSAMKKEQAVLAGAAAAASHQRELRDNEASSDNNGLRKAVFGEAAGAMTVTGTGKPPVRVDIGDKKASVDVNGANDIAVNEGEQLEEVFGDVKAEISAVRGEATKNAPYAARQPAERLSSSAQVSRAQAVQLRIGAFDAKAELFSQRLYSQLRTIRNLAILTPFQRSTRDRIAAAIPPLGLRIRQDRIHLARLQMYASMLRQDHDREQHEWSQSRHVALQAAAKSLRDPKAVRAVVDDVSANDEPSVPTLSLPDPDEVGDDQVLFGSSPGELPVVMRRSSDEMVRRPTVSRQVSANSFVSFSGSVGPELRWSSSDLLIAIDTTRGRQIDSPLATPGSESSGGHSTSMVLPLSDVDEGAGRNQSTTDDRNGHHSSTDPELMGRRVDKGMNEEIAEDWQKTLAAKRVSLANLPHGDMREVSRRMRGPSEEVDLGSSHDE